jgi:hypothetical protein
MDNFRKPWALTHPAGTFSQFRNLPHVPVLKEDNDLFQKKSVF